MDDQGASARELEDRAMENAIEELVESLDDIHTTRRARDEFLRSAPRPTPPRSFDNLQAFLDYHWQVQTYNDAAQELNNAVVQAEDNFRDNSQNLWDAFPLEVPLRYTYRGRRDGLHNQSYLIVKLSRGFQVEKQALIEGG